MCVEVLLARSLRAPADAEGDGHHATRAADHAFSLSLACRSVAVLIGVVARLVRVLARSRLANIDSEAGTRTLDSHPPTITMSHSHAHGGGGDHSGHSHGSSSSSAHSHTSASGAASARPAAPAAGASHSHSGSSATSECDYCSSILSHGAAQKAAAIRAKEIALRRAHQMMNPATTAAAAVIEAETDTEDEEEEDEQDKMILPGQRVEFPLDRRVVTGFTLGIVFLALKIVRSILMEKTASG